MSMLLGGYINPSGISVKFWKIGAVSKSPIYRTVDITVYGYLSEEAKNNNLQPVETRKVRINWVDYEKYLSIPILSQEGNNDLKKLYEYIMENEEFFKQAIKVD